MRTLHITLFLFFLSFQSLSQIYNNGNPNSNNESINLEDGLTCATAFSYQYVNDPAVTGATTFANDEEWWAFELIGNYDNVTISLCSSGFDTKLEVYSDCNSSYLSYNDDYCGAQSQINFNYLSAGIYYVKVYGYGSFFGSYNLSINADIINPCVFVFLEETNVQCNGEGNGSIDLTLIDFSGNQFYYLWNTGATTPNLNSLTVGTYEVTVSDDFFCSVSHSIIINQPDSLLIESSIVNPGCESCADGSISTSISGGSTPYSYMWSTGETTQNISNLYYGNYNLTVIDDHACDASTNYQIFYSAPDTQQIALHTGWNMFSTYKYIVNPSLNSLLISIENNYSIVKNWEGEVYLPQYGVNTFDTVEVEYGFQIKMNSNDTLCISGPTYVPDSVVISLPSGWCMLGYPRYIDGDISVMMNPIVSHILIIKDEDGQVYWPLYNVDQIVNMHPGNAFQIKTDTIIDFTFPPYLGN